LDWTESVILNNAYLGFAHRRPFNWTGNVLRDAQSLTSVKSSRQKEIDAFWLVKLELWLITRLEFVLARKLSYFDALSTWPKHLLDVSVQIEDTFLLKQYPSWKTAHYKKFAWSNAHWGTLNILKDYVLLALFFVWDALRRIHPWTIWSVFNVRKDSKLLVYTVEKNAKIDWGIT